MTTRTGGPHVTPQRPIAPWTRTRLRTAPGSALAFAALVLLTAFLAAAFPRAVDTNESSSLRQDLSGARPARSMLELTTPQPGLELPQSAREDALRPEVIAAAYRKVLPLLPAPVRADTTQSAYGVQTTEFLVGQEAWLPRPDGLPPEFTLAAQAGLAHHSTIRTGRLPTAPAGLTMDARELEAVVTTATAEVMRMHVGSLVHIGTSDSRALAVRITGIVDPVRPEGNYWSGDQILRTPGLSSKGGRPPLTYWNAGLLLAPEAAPALLGTLGEPQAYWRIAPDVTGLTAQQLPLLSDRVASLENGPELLRLKQAAGQHASLNTDMDDILASHMEMRSAVRPVVAVAAIGTGTVAAVTLAMTGGLSAARRGAELALLRARGGSLRGIGGRLLVESAVVALPASGVGLVAAILSVPEGRMVPAVVGVVAVAVLACVALPLCALALHRRPRLRAERADAVKARPGRRRTVAELSLLLLAVGAVVTLRRRGTSDSGDHLVSAGPVLVGLIAALVLARLHPLPLRWAARPARRLRGALGFLSLARAGRSSATGVLPLLALLIALTTAAFGGAVLSGVADARDHAALLAVGADARISRPGPSGTGPLPDGLEQAVQEVHGVQVVAPVWIGPTFDLPRAHPVKGDLSPALVAVEPQSYARITRALGSDTYPGQARQESPGPKGAGVLNVIASPGVAETLGHEPQLIRLVGRDFTVRVVAVRSRMPGVVVPEFLLVDAAELRQRVATTVLLAAGEELDVGAVRAAAHAGGADVDVQLRSEVRASFADSPLQTGTERIYAAAIAAGAGYAVLALLLSLLQSAPERTALLARLRTMGLTRRQGRRLLLLEALPQTAVAALGGLLVGWATVWLLAPGVDLTRLALASVPGLASGADVSLRADAWSLALPALGVVALAGAVAAGQAWWVGRHGSITELRAGDMR
ncbi:FtsX-like permease family protein [Streptomyces sp. NBC_01727]|uniref:FtsX-like permease family protein n=1 Tax=Streptomyces sp. NBC_01727 TaxID=2975924 RepID=UPI002E12A4BA|nr:ABC transporter permease [Streptomyces sp. NBC_01727]